MSDELLEQVDEHRSMQHKMGERVGQIIHRGTSATLVIALNRWHLYIAVAADVITFLRSRMASFRMIEFCEFFARSFVSRHRACFHTGVLKHFSCPFFKQQFS